MAGVSVKFKAIDEISSKFDAMVTAGERALDAFDKMESSADKAYSTVSDGAEQASGAMDRATKATDYWTDAIGNYDKGAMEAIYTTEELVELGFKTEDALSEVADTAEKATEELDKFGKESEDAADKSGKFGDKSKDAVIGLDDVLASAGIVMALHEIGAAFMDCSDAAAQFETSMAVVSTIADSTALSSEQISAQIKQVSKDTAIAVTDLADATYGAISASIATADAVSFVEQANQLAVGGFTSQATAVDVLTTAINAYGLSADRAGQLSDYLVTTQNLGKTTVDQLASSIGMVIPSAAAFNVQMDNLSTAYAILTANGVQTAQSTTYLKAMFTELASEESKVAEVLREETGASFAELMEQGYSLGDVMQILGDSVDGNTTAFMNMWGSMEAGSGAVSLYNSGAEKYAQVLNQMQQSAGATAKAYEIMTDTTEFGSQRMENSFNNLKIAFGEDLNPIVRSLQNGIADITDGFTALLNKYPAVSALLTGLTVTVGTLTVAIGAYKVATVAADLATKAWTAAMNMNPVFLAVSAITALTAGLITLAVVMEENTEKTEQLTAVSQKNADELAALNAEYERTIELHGADSEEAIALEQRINGLSEEYENSKQTMEEYNTAFQETMDAYAEMTERHKEQESSMSHEGATITYMVNRLEALAAQTDLTAGEQQEMLTIIQSLNEEVPGLSLSYDTLTGKLSQTSDAIRNLAEAEVASRQYDTYNEQLIERIAARVDLEEKVTEAIRNQEIAQENLNELYEDDRYERYLQLLEDAKTWTASSAPRSIPRELTDFGAEFSAAQAEVEKYGNEIDTATAALEENEAEITRISEEMARLSGATDEATESTDGYTEAASVIGDYQEEILALCDAYDAAYESAVSSIEGQYSLWDKADEVVATSKENIEGALQSQIDYWTAYNDNLDSLSARADDIEGLSDLLADLSDGSAESAATLAGLEGLSDEDLSAVVSQYTELKEAQTSTAESLAELETDFTEKMESIQTEMETVVGNMNMSEDARENGKATIDAYVGEIESGIARAQTAIDSLSFANTTLSGGGFHEYASGTPSAAPGLALVGEEGPELVDFSGGERVYTADETDDILSGRGGDDFYVAPAGTEESSEASNRDKTITLKLEGAGEMKVGTGGMSKADVVDILIENVKEVLMGIIQQEILEEGDLSYEF